MDDKVEKLPQQVVGEVRRNQSSEMMRSGVFEQGDTIYQQSKPLSVEGSKSPVLKEHNALNTMPDIRLSATTTTQVIHKKERLASSCKELVKNYILKVKGIYQNEFNFHSSKENFNNLKDEFQEQIRLLK